MKQVSSHEMKQVSSQRRDEAGVKSERTGTRGEDELEVSRGRDRWGLNDEDRFSTNMFHVLSLFV